MSSFESEPVSAASVAADAACWVLRHDRGLSPEEQDEFSQWLATDPRRREAFATHRWGWEELDRLVGIQTTLHANPDPDLLAPPRRRARPRPRRAAWFGSLALAAAAAVAVVFYFARFHATISPSAVAALIPQIEQRTLDDGSVVELNRGAVIEVAFTADERRVTLVHGEANFQVAKNKTRPFIVSAGGVDVRAVGTAFNVRLGSRDVEVLVTEGRVGVQGPGATAAVAPLQLGAGEHTVLPRAPSSLAAPTAAAAPTTPLIALLTPSQVEEKLRWQPRLLDFTDQPLAEIVAEFNHHNPVRLALGDSALHTVHLSATFRSDNVQGFVRLMVSDFGMTVEHGATADELVLREAR